MTVQLHSVTFASPDPRRDAGFWASVLARPLIDDEDGDGILLVGDGRQVGLRFTSGPGRGEQANRMHLHLVDDPRGQRAAIAECVRHGAVLRGSGRVPARSYAAMADPVGDDFCVIEDANTYLAGCGPLGEVTCEGTRSVGEFWSGALEWPLVWDEGEETAIQSPHGGTKIAWSGERAPAGTASERQFFVLTVGCDEFDRELARLEGLGASRLADDPADGAALADPDGCRFTVRVLPRFRD